MDTLYRNIHLIGIIFLRNNIPYFERCENMHIYLPKTGNGEISRKHYQVHISTINEFYIPNMVAIGLLDFAGSSIRTYVWTDVPRT